MKTLLSFAQGYVWWIVGIAFAAVLALAGVQTVRLADTKADLANEKTVRIAETNSRLQAALDHKAAISKLEAAHAAAQQLKENEYVANKARLESERLAAVADAGRLRSKLAAFTASGIRPGEAIASAYQRAADRLQVVGGLLDESIDLEAESRSIIKRRDAEVDLLLNQIRTDRQACSPAVS